MKTLSQLVRQLLRRFVAGFNFGNGHKGASAKPKEGGTLARVDVLSEKDVALVDEIIRLMQDEQIYKCPNLGLSFLSDKLQRPAYLVTRAINRGLGINFYDLINRYRVEEAKSLLMCLDYKRFTLMTVAFEAGFNSKTTFNTVFKKITGVSPSTYRKLNCSKTETELMNRSEEIKGLRKAA